MKSKYLKKRRYAKQTHQVQGVMKKNAHKKNSF